MSMDVTHDWLDAGLFDDQDGYLEVPHPAKFSEGIIETMAQLLVDHHGCVLDPFAGTGRIHRLEDLGSWCTHGVEIESEWAEYHHKTIQGDSRNLPYADGSFAVVATSPTYGNGMGQRKPYMNRSKGVRHSYADRLGRELTAGNTGAVRWGKEYCDLHYLVWAEVARVLNVGGRLLLNFKDPIRKGQLMPVSGWHLAVLAEFGIIYQGAVPIATPGMRAGEHASHRIGSGEIIFVCDKLAA